MKVAEAGKERGDAPDERPGTGTSGSMLTEDTVRSRGT
jgi:hypothetical protein